MIPLTIVPKATVQKCSFLNSNTPSNVDASRKHLSNWPIMCDGVVCKQCENNQLGSLTTIK